MTVQIDTTAENKGLRLIKQGSHPSTPSAGHVLAYYITGTPQPGLFIKDDQGREIGPFITGSAASGGGITQSFLGYNTIGGSVESMPTRTVYTKQITVPSNGILTSIDAYIALNTSDNVASLCGALYSDNGGDPQLLLNYTMNLATSLLFDTVGGGGGLSPRWFSIPCGTYVTPGNYWISVMTLNNSLLNLYYDGSGADRYYTSGGDWISDWGFYSPTTSSNKYSIRASFIS